MLNELNYPTQSELHYFYVKINSVLLNFYIMAHNDIQILPPQAQIRQSFNNFMISFINIFLWITSRAWESSFQGAFFLCIVTYSGTV